MKGAAIAYSEAELLYIQRRARYPRRELHAAFVKAFGRHDVSLSNLNGLCKRKGWMTGRTGRYDPGRTPENKGRKMPYNANSARTRFRKGHVPHTFRGAGHESICSKDGYVILIVDEVNPYTGAKTRPVHKHRWLWEKEHGPVPEGMRLKCLDGDKTNTDPSNWKALPFALAPRLNGRFGRGYDQAPPELRPIIMATAELEHGVRETRSRRAGAGKSEDR